MSKFPSLTIKKNYTLSKKYLHLLVMSGHLKSTWNSRKCILLCLN